MTGSWDEVASRRRAQTLADAWRPFKVTKVIEESSVIRSFYLETFDGVGLIPHAAGQHLRIRVTPPGATKPVIRTYTLSTAPADGLYRINVKRQGLVSAHLHVTPGIGSVIETRAPAAQFTVDAAERRPAVLRAAGVGVTPRLTMLRHIVYEGIRTRQVCPTWFFQSARSLAERAFTKEIHHLTNAASGAVHVVRLLTDSNGAEMGKDSDVAARLDVALLSETLRFNDYDFHLCGPAASMQSLYDGLRKLNIAGNQIHAEAFGPAGLHRETGFTGETGHVRMPADRPTPVAFIMSGKEARWKPESGSLPDLAESRSLTPEFSCRRGSCGTCRARIVEGAVAYPFTPDFKVASGEALLCCAVPVRAEEGSGRNLLLDS